MTVGETTTTVYVGDTINNYDPKKDNEGNDINGDKATVKSSSSDNGYGSTDQTFSLSSAPTEWIVLGVDDDSGQLLITPKSVVKTSLNYYFYLQGISGYTKGIEELDKISKLYGQGKYADKEKTRSINVDDINKVTGYDPMKEGNQDGQPYHKDQINQYGSEVEYSWDSSGTKKVKYTNKTVTSKSGTSNYTTFKYPNDDGTETTLGDSETKTFKSTYYYYYPQSLSTSSSGSVGSVQTGSKEYQALFNGECYWIGSQFVHTREGDVSFGLRNVYSNGSVYGYSLFGSSSGDISSSNYYVRPAVCLESGITLEGDSNKGWTIKGPNEN